MKWTKPIHCASFRRSWDTHRPTSIALTVIAVLMLAGCEKSDETVSLYQNADDYSIVNLDKSTECTTMLNNALKEAERIAPKYTTREDCIAEFDGGQCQRTPAQAGTVLTGEGQTQVQNQSGSSFWILLMVGYTMGRLMDDGMDAQQPLFSSRNPVSPTYGKHTDTSDKNYGAATPGRIMTVSKTAMAPKPTTTSTATRGGFGEPVAKQSTMQYSASDATTRPMGG